MAKAERIALEQAMNDITPHKGDIVSTDQGFLFTAATVSTASDTGLSPFEPNPTSVLHPGELAAKASKFRFRPPFGPASRSSGSIKSCWLK